MPTVFHNRRQNLRPPKPRKFQDKYSIPFDLVNEALDLYPQTGRLFWKERPVASFRSIAIADAWNRRYAGREAFTAKDGAGYRCGAFMGIGFQAHYIVWMLHTGAWPKHRIDHISGCISDNRPVNLRDVEHSENARNRAIPVTNKSGVLGVYFHTKLHAWVAFISAKGKVTRLGVFQDRAEAVAVRKQAEILNGYHPNHGRKPA